MSVEKDKSETLEFMSQAPTVEIKPHPKEILDLDEETVAIARAKLAGVDFNEIYGNDDQVSSLLLISQQVQRIRGLFRTPEELRGAFSSSEEAYETYKALEIDKIDLSFLRNHSFKIGMTFHSDEDLLSYFGFEHGATDRPQSQEI